MPDGRKDLKMNELENPIYVHADRWTDDLSGYQRVVFTMPYGTPFEDAVRLMKKHAKKVSHYEANVGPVIVECRYIDG